MKIKVVKPFRYYLNGYERRDFQIGEYDVPLDCAAYAEEAGYVRKETKSNVSRNRTLNTVRS